ncbi:MAG TPA: phosphatase PAP2 family protein [Puia sp.]|jgi:membrane-associated phospholipid phosphatase|nr:phosphatase PAP2 family protein [Puia sp.]
MPLLKSLDQFDRSLFRLVQQGSTAFLDGVMPYLRDPYIWIPVYAFMFYYAFRASRSRVGEPGPWFFILLSIVTVAITDSVAAQVMKPLFGRLRPCHDPEMQVLLRNLVSCGGLYSMPSNHASNHFGLATFWYYSIRAINGRKWRWLWLWAALICYAQVYVGKHYPFDVLVGAVFGFLTGWGMSRLFIYWKSKLHHLPGGGTA